jgi:hypothetical protein
LANFIFTLPPKRIVLGGGVMRKAFLYEKIRIRVHELLNNYLNHPVLTSHMDEYIVPPALGDRSVCWVELLWLWNWTLNPYKEENEGGIHIEKRT